jgi:uncharacterized protein YgiM (DUF1202 family)
MDYSNLFKSIIPSIPNLTNFGPLIDLKALDSLTKATLSFKIPEYFDKNYFAQSLSIINAINRNDLSLYMRNSYAFKMPRFDFNLTIPKYDSLFKIIAEKSFSISSAISSFNNILENKCLAITSMSSSLTSIVNDDFYGNRLITEYEVDDLVSKENEIGLEEVIIDIKRNCISGVKVRRHFKRNAFNYISLLFGLYTYIQSNIDTETLRKQLFTKIEDSKSEIVEVFKDEIGVLRKMDRKYVVLRDVNLRTRPSNRSDIIMVLKTNNLVDILEEKKEWVKVIFFDFVSGNSFEGWIFKKYLTNGRRLY